MLTICKTRTKDLLSLGDLLLVVLPLVLIEILVVLLHHSLKAILLKDLDVFSFVFGSV